MKNSFPLKQELKEYIVETSLTDKSKIKDDTLIFDAGLLDSMGLLFLIEFLNEKYGIEVEDDELNPKNFESINSIVAFVQSKKEIA